MSLGDKEDGNSINKTREVRKEIVETVGLVFNVKMPVDYLAEVSNNQLEIEYFSSVEGM